MGNLACGLSGHKAAAAADEDDDDDGYRARMRISDDILVERYRHKMQRQQQRQRPPGSARPRVSFRAGSFESQASSAASSPESERRDFLLRLVDSLPETFLDDDAESTESRTAVLVHSALVNEYVDGHGRDNDEDDGEAEALETPATAAVAAAAAAASPLSDSAHSHTYESIKSVEQLGCSDPSRERAPSPPPPPPPTSGGGRRRAAASTSPGRQASRKSSGKVRQANGSTDREFELVSRVEQTITG